MKPVLVLLVPSLILYAGVSDHADVKGAERLFEAWLTSQIAYRGLPGVAIGVVHDQELIWSHGFGYADIEKKVPVTPATRFRMASHSKLFTATAIMQLRDAGKLRLDDPISRYLPWFTHERVESDDPDITVEELLTHSSGLSREAGSHWSDLKFPTADEVRNYVRQNKAIYPPEVRWKYSNLAYTLAGMIVEAVSGESFASYVQNHIFNPLAMTSSTIDRPDNRLAIGYGRRMPDGKRQTFPFVDARAMAPATGVTSTVEDMAKFVSLQFRKGKRGGNQILSSGALRQMHRVRMLENNWTAGNAIGFAVNREGDRLYIGHGGSYPGYKTHTLIQLDDKIGVIVLTNGDDSEPNVIARHLMKIVGSAVAKAATGAAKQDLWDPSWGRFAGLYRSGARDTAVVELNRQLVTIDPTGNNPDQQSKLVPVGNGLFRLEAPAGGTAIGETVRFIEQDNEVVRMFIGGSFSERVRP